MFNFLLQILKRCCFVAALAAPPFAGDFLLARSSVALASLENYEVVELVSTVIEHLVRGRMADLHSQSSTDAMKRSGRFSFSHAQPAAPAVAAADATNP